jgi:hypothetical protein
LILRVFVKTEDNIVADVLSNFPIRDTMEGRESSQAAKHRSVAVEIVQKIVKGTDFPLRLPILASNQRIENVFQPEEESTKN